MSALFDMEAYESKDKPRLDICLHGSFNMPDVSQFIKSKQNSKYDVLVTVMTTQTSGEHGDVNTPMVGRASAGRVVLSDLQSFKPACDIQLCRFDIDQIYNAYRKLVKEEDADRFDAIFEKAVQRMKAYKAENMGRQINLGWMHTALADSCLEKLGCEANVIPTDISQTRPSARKVISDYLQNEHVLETYKYRMPGNAMPATAWTREKKHKIIFWGDEHLVVDKSGEAKELIEPEDMLDGLAKGLYHAGAYLHGAIDHTGAAKLAVMEDNENFATRKAETLNHFFAAAKLDLRMPELQFIQNSRKSLVDAALES